MQDAEADYKDQAQDLGRDSTATLATTQTELTQQELIIDSGTAQKVEEDDKRPSNPQVYEHINAEDDDDYSDYFEDLGDNETDKSSSVKKKKKHELWEYMVDPIYMMILLSL